MDTGNDRAAPPDPVTRRVRVIVYVGEGMLSDAHDVAQHAASRHKEVTGEDLPPPAGPHVTSG